MVDMPDVKDTTVWSYDDLVALSSAVDNEIRRRYTIESVESQMNTLSWDYSKAIGRKTGDDWSQPTGAHDAYPEGFIVEHGGKNWVSLIPGNVWEPGGSGWREYVEPGSGVVPEYIAPTGAHDAYMVGDRVTFQGRVYESVIDSNVYSPVEYAQGWVEIDPNAPVEEPEVPGESEPEPDPEPEVPVDPEPEPEPEEPVVPEWVQPTGGHDAYGLGDQVLFEGQVWESTIPANTYSPSAYPAGWTRIV